MNQDVGLLCRAARARGFGRARRPCTPMMLAELRRRPRHRPPPPPPTEPFLVAADKLSSGDTAWMLTSTALVLMMCVPGLALFYGGMVRKKNVLATLMQSFACTCVVTILWWVVGYSLAFTPGNGFIGGASRALFEGMRYIHGETSSPSPSRISRPRSRRPCTRCSR